MSNAWVSMPEPPFILAWAGSRRGSLASTPVSRKQFHNKSSLKSRNLLESERNKMSIRMRPRAIVASFVVTGVVGTAGLAVAAVPDAAGVHPRPPRRTLGQVRIIDHESGSPKGCGKNEVSVDWQPHRADRAGGPVGPQGPVGPTGAVGPQGLTGATGRTWLSGAGRAAGHGQVHRDPRACACTHTVSANVRLPFGAAANRQSPVRPARWPQGGEFLDRDTGDQVFQSSPTLRTPTGWVVGKNGAANNVTIYVICAAP